MSRSARSDLVDLERRAPKIWAHIKDARKGLEEIVARHALPAITRAYETGEPPRLLPDYREG